MRTSIRAAVAVAGLAGFGMLASAYGQSKLFQPDGPDTRPTTAPDPKPTAGQKVLVEPKVPAPPSSSPAAAPPVSPSDWVKSPTAAGPEAATATYDVDRLEAKLGYFKALMAADVKLIGSLNRAQRADPFDPKVDADLRSAVARLKEHEAAMQSALAPDRHVEVASARWGTGSKWADVTEQVRSLAADRDRALANPRTLDADPAPGWKKVLEIVYFRDGERQRVVIREDAEIAVPNLIPKGDDSIDGKSP